MNEQEYNNLQTLLSALKGLSLQDVVKHYLEAKTGRPDAVEELPSITQELIGSLNEILNDAITDAQVWPQTYEECFICERIHYCSCIKSSV